MVTNKNSRTRKCGWEILVFFVLALVSNYNCCDAKKCRIQRNTVKNIV